MVQGRWVGGSLLVSLFSIQSFWILMRFFLTSFTPPGRSLLFVFHQIYPISFCGLVGWILVFFWLFVWSLILWAVWLDPHFVGWLIRPSFYVLIKWIILLWVDWMDPRFRGWLVCSSFCGLFGWSVVWGLVGWIPFLWVGCFDPRFVNWLNKALFCVLVN